MRTRKLFFQAVTISVLLFVGIQTINSCKKDNPEPSMGSVVNIAPANNIKATITKAATLDALPADFKANAEDISVLMGADNVETFSAVDLVPVVAFYRTNMALSADEVTKLKANDPYTYDLVINRMAQVAPFTDAGELAGIRTGMEANGDLNVYLLKETGNSTNMYATNYYQGALDLQKFIAENTIPMLQKIIVLKETGTKSASISQQANNGLSNTQKDLVAAMLYIILVQKRGMDEVYLKVLTALHEGGTAH